KQQVGGSLRVSLLGGAALRAAFASFGEGVSDGEALHVITTPERLNEILGVAVREHLTATVGPVSLEEAFLRVVGKSIDAET
ncbi:MAG: hypothetical protein L3K07_09515, partial [Thermoplasmata archaeon]|nr:hypothetical protein [Thermoplasmata archaeon]